MSVLSSTLYFNECAWSQNFRINCTKLDFSHFSYKQHECQVHLDFGDSVCTMLNLQHLGGFEKLEHGSYDCHYKVFVVVIWLLYASGDLSFCPISHRFSCYYELTTNIHSHRLPCFIFLDSKTVTLLSEPHVMIRITTDADLIYNPRVI